MSQIYIRKVKALLCAGCLHRGLWLFYLYFYRI